MKLYYEESNNDNKEASAPSQHTLQGDNIWEETKNQHQKMKDKPFKEKFEYYFGYYKFHALAIVVGIVALISIVKAIASSKDYCFSSLIINSVNINAETLSDDFAQYAMLDTDNYNCYIDANLSDSLSTTGANDGSTSTKFTAMMATKDLDVTVYDSIHFYIKGLNNAFIDLKTVLSDEEIKKYEDYFYYIDGKEIARASEDDSDIIKALEFDGDSKAIDEDIKKHMDPSLMEEPIAIGIIINDSNLIKSTYAYSKNIPVLGIIANSERTETAVKFIEFIFDNDIDFSKHILVYD